MYIPNPSPLEYLRIDGVINRKIINMTVYVHEFRAVRYSCMLSSANKSHRAVHITALIVRHVLPRVGQVDVLKLDVLTTAGVGAALEVPDVGRGDGAGETREEEVLQLE
jgi:hypothetical protein